MSVSVMFVIIGRARAILSHRPTNSPLILHHHHISFVFFVWRATRLLINLFREFPLIDAHRGWGRVVGAFIAAFAVAVFGIPTGVAAVFSVCLRVIVQNMVLAFLQCTRGI